MTIHTVRSSLVLVLALSVVPALAEHEGPEAHASHATVTVTLDSNDIRPSSTRMSHGDVLSFVNYSTQPIEVTFIEPADLEKKIRCGLVHGKETKPAAPWAVFTWKDGKLVGQVPPGQFASVCSLEPGRYAFTAIPIGRDPRGPDRGSVLPKKGTIDVQ
jgi:plastocyanin